MAYSSFEDLEVWKRGCQLAVDVCAAMETCRDFSLRDQIQRAAISVPSNIAEGYERDSQRDFIRFLRIAKGSAGELRTQLYIATRQSLISRETSSALVDESRQLAAMLQSLIQYRQSLVTNAPSERSANGPET